MQSILLQVNKQKVRVRETHEKQTVKTKNEGKHTNIQTGKIKMNKSKWKESNTKQAHSQVEGIYPAFEQSDSGLQNRWDKTQNERKN